MHSSLLDALLATRCPLGWRFPLRNLTHFCRNAHLTLPLQLGTPRTGWVNPDCWSRAQSWLLDTILHIVILHPPGCLKSPGHLGPPCRRFPRAKGHPGWSRLPQLDVLITSQRHFNGIRYCWPPESLLAARLYSDHSAHFLLAGGALRITRCHRSFGIPHRILDLEGTKMVGKGH